MKFVILAALLIAGIAAAPPRTARTSMTLHVPAAVAQHTARLIAAAPPTRTMQLAISLPLHDETGLQALIGAIYDPAGPLYRRYLSTAEFTARFGPSVAEYQALLHFAQTNNLHPHGFAANRRVLDVEGSVADVQRALHVTIGLYQHPREPRLFYAPDREPTTDAGVSILHISGLDNFTRPVSHLMRGSAAMAHTATGSGPNGSFIGSDIRAAYYGGKALTGTGQSLGLFEFTGYNLADLALYFATVRQPLTVPVVGVSLNGVSLDCSGACNDTESVLDMEAAISMAPGLKQLVMYVGNSDVSIFNAMACDNTSKQLSSSWGYEPDRATVEPTFEEFAVQGQTFVASTGDDGDQLLTGVVWPADDPFVTAVGGTDLQTTGPGGVWQSETGWLDGGGGISPDGVRIPGYQLPFITPANAGSRLHRNVPDVAADADTDNLSCANALCTTNNGGTSYSTPVWAGYIALANQLADALDRPAVGFLNPSLYAIGASASYRSQFHDLTVGSNGRFHAVPGFDLVTGFGSPNGPALLQRLVLGL